MASIVRGDWIHGARVWKAACVLALVLLSQFVGAHKARTAEPVRLYVFAGQSNMVGYSAETSQLPAVDPKLTAPTANVRFYGPTDDYAAKWTTLQAPTEVMEPVHHSGFGPEISAAPLLAARHAGTTVAIVKLARGGTSLFYDWNPNNPIGLYPQLVARVRAAQRDLASQLNASVRVSGLFWMQGETDAAFRGPAEEYQQSLTEFIAAARRDFSAPDMPFVIGRIAKIGGVYRSFRYTDVVRGAQSHVSSTVRRTYLVSTDGLELDPSSRIHFDTRGIVDLGRRFVGRFPL